MSERSEISASPVVLEFVYPSKDVQRTVVQVKNESDHRLALKIKTTNNTCFKVSFVYAVLQPRGEKKLTVGCAPIPDTFNGVRDDKVVVCYTEIPDGEVDAREFWKTAPPLKAIRLPVMYRAQGEPSVEQAAEKPSEEKVEAKKEARADEPEVKPKEGEPAAEPEVKPKEGEPAAEPEVKPKEGEPAAEPEVKPKEGEPAAEPEVKPKEEAPAAEPEVKPKEEAPAAEPEEKPKEGTEGKVQEGTVPSADSEEKQVGGAANDSEDGANADQPEAKNKEEESDNKSDSSESNAPGDEE
ncbi:Sperm-specific class P protein 34 [Trichinella murrelli]|uniref:Major sperm protein n=1 Tax=Trichinella murrelli TaxID=144512 RepID=A0A0V0U747_9BILA|nr:Sperm-specific class P protein 34 [Trichinella murrelli]